MTTPKGWPKKTEVSMVPGINESYWVKRINEMRDLCLTVHNALMAENEKKIKELETVLNCWHDVFGTTQLTHAKDRLDCAEKEIERLKMVIKDKARVSKEFIENDSNYINRLLEEIRRLRSIPTYEEVRLLVSEFTGFDSVKDKLTERILNLIEERRK